MDNILTGHDCKSCEDQGHCSIEPLVGYFQSHLDDLDALNKQAHSLLDDGWAGTLAVDLLAISSKNPDQKNNLAGDTMYLCIAVGWMLAKGVDMTSCKITPSIHRTLIATVAAMLGRMEGVSELHNSNSTN